MTRSARPAVSLRGVSALYAWLRRHPRLVDAVPAVFLALGSVATAISQRAYVLVLVTFGLTVPIVFRRAHPVAAFAVAITAGALQLLFWMTSLILIPADLAIVVLLYTLAAYTTRKISIAGLAACLLGSAAALPAIYQHLASRGVSPGVSPGLAFGAGLFAGPCLLAWVLGDSMRYRRAYYVSLEERAARLERDRDVQAQMAAAAERARIARELHDVVAHNVSVMIVQADGAAYAMDSEPERAREALAAISATGRQALAEMRVMLGVLRKSGQSATAIADQAATAIASESGEPAAMPAEAATDQPATAHPADAHPATTHPAADRATPEPLAATAALPAYVAPRSPTAPAQLPSFPSPPDLLFSAPGPALAPMPGISQLEDLLDQARAGGLEVSCTIGGQMRPLPSGTELTAYRIIQESLTNTRKHAGPGARADVGLRYLPDAIELTVTDNGIGADASCDGHGHGLTGMHERVALYGGILAVGPLPSGGYGVRALLPANPAQAGAA